MAIGPIFPGLQLQRGMPIEDQEDEIYASLRFAHWIKSALTGEIHRYFPEENRRFINAQTLRDSPEIEGLIAHRGMLRGTYQQYIAILKGYFERAQEGDLIIIPSRSYLEESLLAEFVDGPEYIEYIRLRHKGLLCQIPARRFRPIRKLEKRLLPTDFLRIIERPSAFVQVGSVVSRDLVELAYGSFVSENVYASELTIESDTLKPGTSAALFRLLEALAGEEAEDISVSISVNSPGFVRIAAGIVAPLVVSVLMVLALKLGPDALEAAASELITIGNSLSPDAECLLQVSSEVYRRLQNFGVDEWARACEDARALLESGDITLRPTVEVEDERAAP